MSHPIIIYTDPAYTKVVWGVPEKLTAAEMEISNLPADALKVRIRLRPRCEGRAFVKFSNRVENWILGFDSGKLFLMEFTGVNYTKPYDQA